MNRCLNLLANLNQMERFLYRKNKRWSFYTYRMGIQESMGKLPQKQVDQIMILSGGK